MRALPRGDPGDTTSTPSPFSSIEPTKKRSVVVTLVADRHDGAGGDRRLDALFHIHDLCSLESGLELADAGFHFPLSVLGGVIVAVLGQVAEGPGSFDGRVISTRPRVVRSSSSVWRRS